MLIDKVWLDLRNVSSAEEAFGLINALPVETLMVRPDIFTDIDSKFGRRIRLMFYIENAKELQKLDKGNVIISEDEAILAKAKEKGMECGLYVKVIDQETLNKAWKSGINYNYLIIEFKDETNIPLELVIAQIEGNRSSTALFKVVNSIEDAIIASQVLEKGSDGVVLRNITADNIEGIEKLVAGGVNVQLQEVVVDSIEYIGMGDRGCIDTTSLMGQDEGMIVGSTSAGGILVCAETHYLPYMELRPFRVNAGAVHSYVMAQDNTTRYISEMKAGDKLFCINTKGEVRTVAVGRNKIEKRPLLLIKGRIGKVEINAILQDDWHVRVMGIDGKPKNITTLKKGDKLFGYLMKSGRHVGLNVSETILEK